MDIVSRLKSFLNDEKIAITQFADNCGIPRPTLSQLLNGRNKKVSDDLLRKIHEGYPNLSMLWLMFGEGTMYVNHNHTAIQASLPHIDEFDFEHEPDATATNDDSIPKIETGLHDDTSNVSIIFDDTETSVTSPPIQPKNNRDEAATIQLTNHPTKKIVNIIVYYDDNSFESFLPK